MTPRVIRLPNGLTACLISDMANLADPSAPLQSASDLDSETDSEESSDSDTEVTSSESESQTESEEDDASDDSKPLSRGEKEVKLVCEAYIELYEEKVSVKKTISRICEVFRFGFFGSYWSDEYWCFILKMQFKFIFSENLIFVLSRKSEYFYLSIELLVFRQLLHFALELAVSATPMRSRVWLIFLSTWCSWAARNIQKRMILIHLSR